MKKIKKVGKPMKPKPKRRLVFLSLKKKLEKNDKFIKSPMEDSILSPYNTSQFLISNNSDPFYPEEEDDLDIEINPNPFLPKLDIYPDLIKIENENIEMKDSHLELELESTAAQSQDFTNRKLSFE